MPKRTYAGPVIERNIEVGIIYSNHDLYRNPFRCLAVDSGTGELVILTMAYTGSYNVSLYQPDEYSLGSRGYALTTFTVTDDLSERVSLASWFTRWVSWWRNLTFRAFDNKFLVYSIYGEWL